MINPNQMKTTEPLKNKGFNHLYKADCKTGGKIGEGGRIYRSWSGGRCRILGGDNSDYCYHVMSRTCGGDYLFGDEEKEAFRIIMRRMARFCGVEVLTYAVMSNHFHILARVPCRAKFLKRFDDRADEAEGAGEERLMQHLSILYSKTYIDQVRRELVWMREQHMEADAEKFLLKYKRRLCNISLFTKEVKERFSRWFNKKHARRGTLWMDRFKSVLVENDEALKTIAAYINLNPVRAELVEDPKDYRWCGYAEAVGGSKQARRGLCRVMEKPLDSWGENHEWYRCWLMADGRELQHNKTSDIPTNPSSPSKKQTKKPKPQNLGQISLYQQLRSRIQYFTTGTVLGSSKFINEWFELNREKFSPHRKAAVPIKKKSMSAKLKLKIESKTTMTLYSQKGKIMLGED